jgi:hypothetical protein
MLKTVSLLAILPALTFAFFIPFPVSGPIPESSKVQDEKMLHFSHVDNLEKATKLETHNSKICSFVDYVDTVLCNSTESVVVNQNLNKNETKETNNNFENIKNKSGSVEFNLELDPKDLCPLLGLIDKSFCKSGKGLHMGREKENIDPKDLCPLLELIETKLCS